MSRLLVMNRKKRTDDSYVLRLSEGLLDEYSKTHLLAKSFLEVAGDDGAIANIARRLVLRVPLNENDVGKLGGSVGELVRIVAFGVEKGVNVEKSLGLFIARLRREIRIANTLKAKAGSMRALTYIGVGVFFPLFSGISAVIVSSSLGLFDKSAPVVYGGFIMACAAYVPVILYLTSAFAHPEKTLVANLLSIAPYVILAYFILLMTQTYLSNVL